MPHSSRSCLARRLPSLPFACLRQLLSAHLGSDVATVFSSGPTSVRRLPTWDKMPGSFKDGDNVMSLRQFEDDEPLALVGATGHRLGFWDEQSRHNRYWRSGAVRSRSRGGPCR